MGETDPPKSFALARSLGHLLHRAQQRTDEVFATLHGDDNATLRQFAVLAAISEQNGLTQTDLVRITGVDRSTLTDMMKRLEHKGLVERERTEKDKRAKTVRLTKKGRARLEEAAPHAMAADEALLEALPRNKRRAFLGTLEGLIAAIDAEAVAAEAREAKRKDKKKPKADEPRDGAKKR